ETRNTEALERIGRGEVWHRGGAPATWRTPRTRPSIPGLNTSSPRVTIGLHGCEDPERTARRDRVAGARPRDAPAAEPHPSVDGVRLPQPLALPLPARRLPPRRPRLQGRLALPADAGGGGAHPRGGARVPGGLPGRLGRPCRRAAQARPQLLGVD